MNRNGIDDLFSLFENIVSPADVLTAKMIAQISTAITRERLKLHMNQAEFARHINASQSLVSRWEHGDYNFSIRKIAEIAAALNLDVTISLSDASIQHQSSIEYSEAAGFTKTMYYSSRNEYSNKKSISVVPSTAFSKKQEEKNHASIC